MKQIRMGVGALLLGLLLPLTSLAQTRPQTLIVSAAASLTQAMTEIGRQFESTHPGITVRFNFAGSGTLVQQISKGAPADVLATADTASMQRALTDQRVVPDSVTSFAGNALVLIVPAGSALALTQLADLNHASIKRIVIGQPDSVPAGTYAKQALMSNQLWAELETKLIFAQNVRQATLYVAQNEVDAGFVYATDAAMARSAVNVVLTVDTPHPIVYPIAVVSDSQRQPLARQFIEFITQPTAQRILSEHGFSPLSARP